MYTYRWLLICHIKVLVKIGLPAVIIHLNLHLFVAAIGSSTIHQWTLDDPENSQSIKTYQI
jgi:hypothetical protein